MSEINIRRAGIDDLPRLIEIYNQYVINTPITFDITPVDVVSRKAWFEQFSATGRHQLLVVERDGQVFGYAGTHAFRAKAAYETTTETTIYCAHDCVGQGLGALLYEALFERLRNEDIRSFIAGITLPNEASVRLHERAGFALSGTMHAVGRKFGKYWDVGWYEKVRPSQP